MPLVKQAAPVQQTLVVREVGDYGVKDGADVWFAVDVEGLTPKSFAPDSTYTVETVIKFGKAHIVKVLNGTLLNGTGGVGGTPGPHTGPLPAALPTPAPAALPPTTPAAAAPKAAYTSKASSSETMTKADWAAKDRVVARESAMKSVLSSQWTANYLMPLPPDQQKAKLFELAAEVEAWFYRP